MINFTVRPFAWVKRFIWVSFVVLTLSLPVTITSLPLPSLQVSPAVYAQQQLVKKIYEELAPRMFEKVEPPEIMAISTAIVDECGKTGVDPFFILAMIEAESNFDVEAVSGAGAKGLMQIMPKTFRSVSKAKRMMDPVENVRAGIRYVAKLHAQGFTKMQTLLLAYNAGPNGAIAITKGELEPTAEARAYAPKVLANYYRLLDKEGVPRKDASKRFLVASR